MAPGWWSSIIITLRHFAIAPKRFYEQSPRLSAVLAVWALAQLPAILCLRLVWGEDLVGAALWPALVGRSLPPAEIGFALVYAVHLCQALLAAAFTWCACGLFATRVSGADALRVALAGMQLPGMLLLSAEAMVASAMPRLERPWTRERTYFAVGTAVITIALVVFVVATRHLRARTTAPRWKAFLGLFLVLWASTDLTKWSLGIKPFEMEGPSAEPSLRHLDRFAVAKRMRPRVGDVVVIESPQTGGSVVKRIVGLNGDTVAWPKGELVRNGAPVATGESAPCAFPGASPTCRTQWEELDGARYQAVAHDPELMFRSLTHPEQLTVPDGFAYVVGDHRDRSADSRTYGLVSLAAVQGVVTYLYWPHERAGRLLAEEQPEAPK